MPIPKCICQKPLQRYQNSGRLAHQYNCPHDTAGGHLCHKHFEMRGAKKYQVDNCADCQKAKKEAWDRIQQTQTIDPNQPYGQHISLYCINHPDLRWNTKNIDFIGARTIFYSGTFSGVPECACSSRDLRVVKH